MINGILVGLLLGLFLTTIGVMFVWLALKTRPQQALGMYAVGMFIKTTIGISSCVVITQFTDVNLVGFILTLGTFVCVSYPMTAVVLTTMMKKGNYCSVNSNN